MPKPYKASNGHIRMRRPNGQFFTPTLKDLGFDTNTDYQVCCQCRYGEQEKWIPLMAGGICPKCKSDQKEPKKIPLSELAVELASKINEIEDKPFLTRQDLPTLTDLKSQYKKEFRLCIERAFEAK